MSSWSYLPTTSMHAVYRQSPTATGLGFKLYLINCIIDTDVDGGNIEKCDSWNDFRSKVTAYSGQNFQKKLSEWEKLEELLKPLTVVRPSDPGVFTFGQSVKGEHPCCIAIHGVGLPEPTVEYTHRPDLVQCHMTRQLVEALTSFWRCHFANKTSRSEMVLVLGEPAGLEQELRNDVSSACDLLEQNSSQNSFSGSNLNNVTEFKDALLAALETHSKIESTDFGAYYIEDHQKRITLAICPTFEELRLFLRHISATTRSRDLRIVYCGHGTKSGEIMLFEDNEKPEGLVSGGELRAVFNDLYWSSRPQLSMWFNCCYGLDVVAQMTDEKKPDELKKKLRQFVKATGVDVSVFDIIEEFEAKLRIRESNDLDFQRMIEGNRSLWMAGRGTSQERSQFQIQMNKANADFKLHLIPLSIGVLHGAGELGIVFGNPEHSPVKSEAANNQKIRRLRLKDWEKYPEQCEALFTRDRPGVDCKNEDDVDCPTIQAMQAHCGDSSVIRFRSWAFLIDGGFISTAPCYWKSIQDLAHLHMVILTHGDCDHVNGLRPFFQWRLNYKNRLSHRKPNPEVRKLVIQRGVLRLREWKHAIDLANVAQATLKDEEIADENNIVTMEEQELFKETDDTYGVTVRVILPSSDLAKNANIKLLAERYANRLDTASKELADARNPDIKKGVVKIAKLLQKAKGTEDLAQLRQCGQDIANQFNSEQLLDMNVPDSVKEILEKLVDLRYTEGAILRDTTLINRTGIVLLFKFSTEKNSKLALLTGDADGKDLHENLQKKIPEGSTERSPADGRIHINYVDVPHHGASFTQNNADFLFDTKHYKFDYIVVSTNGRHGHPAKDTLEVLAKYMKSEDSTRLYFTYDPTNEKKNVFVEADIDARRIQYGPMETDNFVKIILEDSVAS